MSGLGTYRINAESEMLVVPVIRWLRRTLHGEIRQEHHDPFSAVTGKGDGKMFRSLKMRLKHTPRIIGLLASKRSEHYESITLLRYEKMQSVERKIWSNQWYYLTLSWTTRIAHPNMTPCP